jgi:hypothetical protein
MTFITCVVEILIVLKQNEAEIVFREGQFEFLHLPSRKLVATLTTAAKTKEPSKIKISERRRDVVATQNMSDSGASTLTIVKAGAKVVFTQ